MNQNELSDKIMSNQDVRNIVGKFIGGYILYQIGTLFGDYIGLVGAYVGLRCNYYKMGNELVTMTFRTYDEERAKNEHIENKDKHGGAL